MRRPRTGYSRWRDFYMKWLFGAVLTLCTVASVFGEGVSVETEKERFSYAIGIQIGQSLIRQGVDLDSEAFYLAIRDALDGSELRLTPEAMQQALSKGESKVSDGFRERAGSNLKAGKAFLAENKEKDGVVELSSGLQYKILRSGAR